MSYFIQKFYPPILLFLIKINTPSLIGIEKDAFKRAFKSKGYRLEEEEVDYLLNRISGDEDGKVRLSDLKAVFTDWDRILAEESKWHEWARKVL